MSARTAVDKIRQRREAERRLEEELRRERERQVARESFERGQRVAESSSGIATARLLREQQRAQNDYDRERAEQARIRNQMEENIRYSGGPRDQEPPITYEEYCRRHNRYGMSSPQRNHPEGFMGGTVSEELNRLRIRQRLESENPWMQELENLWTIEEGSRDQFSRRTFSLTYATSSSSLGDPIPGGSIPVWGVQAHIVVPVVQALPETAKANDIVSLNGRIFVYDGQSWIAAIKNEKEPVEEKGRRIILEDADADKRNSQDE